MASLSGPDTERFRLCDDVVINDIDDGLLVVNLDTGKTWKLNRVAAVVCRGIEHGGGLPSIISEVARQYGVDVAIVRRDVAALVTELRREGLIETRAGG